MALPEMLPTLPALDRAMVWGALLLAVQDGAFSGADYLDLAVRMLATEVCIIAEVLERARRDIADRYVDPAERTARLDRLADAGRRLLADAVSGGPCPGRAGTAPRHHGRERVSYGWGMIPVTAQIRGDRVDDVAVPEGWAVHRAGQGVGAEGRRA